MAARAGGSRAVSWVFGYASLIWRPDFVYRDKLTACLPGFRRVLWQASPDHRGTPEAPGRVATLTRDRAARCTGVAFRLPSSQRSQILAALDEREQGGYERLVAEVRLSDGRVVPAVTYVGWPSNPHYLGPAALSDMVDHIRRSAGPSGANTHYVIELERALRELGEPDADLARLVRCLTGV